MMTQSEADRLEARQADLDRQEAEDADVERRDSDRRRARERLEEEAGNDAETLDALQKAMEEMRADIDRENREEIAEWERIEANRLAACRITMPEEQTMMMDAIRRQYAMAINNLRSGGGAHVAEAIAGLERTRDQAIAGISDGQCQSGGEARFARERQEQIDRMREGREMPVFVKRPDGSIGPAN